MTKLNQQGFTHHLLILGIAVVVVAAVGFTGYRVYTAKNSDSAKAARYRWTSLDTILQGGRGGGETKSNASYKACRLAVDANTEWIYVLASKANDGIFPTISLGVGTTMYSPYTVSSAQWSGRKTLNLQQRILAQKSPKNYVTVSYSEPTGGGESFFDPTSVLNCN